MGISVILGRCVTSSIWDIMVCRICIWWWFVQKFGRLHTQKKSEIIRLALSKVVRWRLLGWQSPTLSCLLALLFTGCCFTTNFGGAHGISGTPEAHLFTRLYAGDTIKDAVLRREILNEFRRLKKAKSPAQYRSCCFSVLTSRDTWSTIMRLLWLMQLHARQVSTESAPLQTGPLCLGANPTCHVFHIASLPILQSCWFSIKRL